MAKTNRIFCEPCEHGGLSLQASVWCNDCDEGFCADCIKGHKTKILRNHHVISISHHLEISDLMINQTCPDHSKTFDSFCPQHDNLLCITCIQSGEHISCGDLVKIQDAAKGVKRSTLISDLDKNTTFILGNINKTLKEYNENKKGLVGQKEAIKLKIKAFRKELNAKLDKLQDRLLNELETMFQKVTANNDDFKDKLQQNEKTFRQLQSKLKQMKTHVSDVQTFIGMKTIEKSVYTEKMKVQANMTKLHQYRLDFKINSSLSVLAELQDFGEIIVDFESGCTQFTEPHNKQAQKSVLPTGEVTNKNRRKKKGQSNWKPIPVDWTMIDGINLT